MGSRGLVMGIKGTGAPARGAETGRGDAFGLLHKLLVLECAAEQGSEPADGRVSGGTSGRSRSYVVRVNEGGPSGRSALPSRRRKTSRRRRQDRRERNYTRPGRFAPSHKIDRALSNGLPGNLRRTRRFRPAPRSSFRFQPSVPDDAPASHTSRREVACGITLPGPLSEAAEMARRGSRRQKSDGPVKALKKADTVGGVEVAGMLRWDCSP